MQWFATAYADIVADAKDVTPPEAELVEKFMSTWDVEQWATTFHATIVGSDAAQRAASFRATAKSMSVARAASGDEEADPTQASSCTRGANGGPVEGCEGAHTHPISELPQEISRIYKSYSNHFFSSFFHFLSICFLFFRPCLCLFVGSSSFMRCSFRQNLLPK